MKKTYFAPETTIVKVEMTSILAGSPDPVGLSKEEPQVTTSEGIGSRRGSIWDDEEE